MGMLGAEHLLIDRQRALEQGPRRRKLALGLQQDSWSLASRDTTRGHKHPAHGAVYGTSARSVQELLAAVTLSPTRPVMMRAPASVCRRT
jgi:hypothetical protein